MDSTESPNKKVREKFEMEIVKKFPLKEYVPDFSICIVGEPGTGKTCLINREFYKKFEKENINDIFFSFSKFFIKINGKIIGLKITELNNCTNPNNFIINKNNFKNSILLILVYAINDEQSFINIDNWLKKIEEVNSNKRMFLVGTKSDLKKREKGL